MESRKTVDSSSSSISSELFGVKDSRKLKSSGIFESVFASPSEMAERKVSHSASYGSQRNDEGGNETWNSKHAYTGYGDQNQNGRSKETSSIDVDESSDNSNFISAVYYGGPDTWCIPNSPSSVSPHNMTGRKVSHSASYGSRRNDRGGNETWNSKHAYAGYGDQNQNGCSKERSSIDVDESSDNSNFISAVYYGGHDTWCIPNSPSSLSPHNMKGRNASYSGSYGSRRNKKEDNKTWKSKHPSPGYGDQGQNGSNKEKNSVDGDEQSQDDSTFIPAVYYGGRDTWFIPNSPSSGSSYKFKKNGGKYGTNPSGSNSASPGNWWEGSLYY